MKDLRFEGEGSLKFKTRLWNDIRKSYSAMLIDSLSNNIPFPGIEYTYITLDLDVENLGLGALL